MEYYYRASTNETFHRCEKCVKTYWYIHHEQVTDNGFVKLDKNPHLYNFCEDQHREQRKEKVSK